MRTQVRNRCTCKCSERIFQGTRGKGLQWNNGPLISKIKTDAYFFYDSDTRHGRKNLIKRKKSVDQMFFPDKVVTK